MPHVVLQGNNDLEPIFKGLKEIFLKDNETILKTQDVFLNQSKSTILIEAFTKEQSFFAELFIIVNKRPDGIVIRLHPRTEIEKTKGVKTLLAEVAKKILEIGNDYVVTKTNLSVYLSQENVAL